MGKSYYFFIFVFLLASCGTHVVNDQEVEVRDVAAATINPEIGTLSHSFSVVEDDTDASGVVTQDRSEESYYDISLGSIISGREDQSLNADDRIYIRFSNNVTGDTEFYGYYNIGDDIGNTAPTTILGQWSDFASYVSFPGLTTATEPTLQNIIETNGELVVRMDKKEWADHHGYRGPVDAVELLTAFTFYNGTTKVFSDPIDTVLPIRTAYVVDNNTVRLEADVYGFASPVLGSIDYYGTASKTFSAPSIFYEPFSYIQAATTQDSIPTIGAAFPTPNPFLHPEYPGLSTCGDGHNLWGPAGSTAGGEDFDNTEEDDIYLSKMEFSDGTSIDFIIDDYRYNYDSSNIKASFGRFVDLVTDYLSDDGQTFRHKAGIPGYDFDPSILGVDIRFEHVYVGGDQLFVDCDTAITNGDLFPNHIGGFLMIKHVLVDDVPTRVDVRTIANLFTLSEASADMSAPMDGVIVFRNQASIGYEY